MVFATLLSGAGSQRNAMANSLFTVFGEDFKVRALLRNFLKFFRNFVKPEKMAF
jgi:hypothetical protein